VTRAALAAVVLVAAALRLHGLGDESFWHDEAWTWGLVRDGGLLWKLTRLDAHPPLYFALLHAWARFGDSEAWLRLPSTLAGIASVLLIARLGRRLGGPRAGLAAALFLALSPYAIRYSREARSYALLFLLCLAALDAVLDLRDDPESRSWIRLGLLGGAVALTHYLGVLFLIALPAFRVPLLRPALLAAAVFSPWAASFLEHATLVDRSFWIPAPTPALVRDSLGELLAGAGPVWLALPFYAALVVRPRALAVLAAVPVVLELILSLRRPLFYTPTFQYVLIPLFLATAVAVAQRPALALLALCFLPGLWRDTTTLRKEDWRGAAREIAAAPGPVVAVPGFVAAGLEAYRVPVILPVEQDSLARPGLDAGAVLGAVDGEPRVWLAWRYGDDGGWRARLGTPRREWSSRGVRLALYEPAPTRRGR
jgi:4-amino-4-deoxy-L-arabinose transferase-like glycosyltransferase